ncbi:MAG TPA: RagB/SusD family nutrient uptake outer membrane protein [Dinghuibacter sp.]|uniref:RagB/SusD family nutrient uptake outer membrane protein n=1 Tax=Dinghuibacter sp. TaxID=2024697 RepID=UPI002BA33BEF|nr:RagB/SusD family nutrient uptake outer membrane protein [Dinghuibacter sp.]HTJ13732.1 RagB/SusD family nutrient uptake outer membrane protein [Dinghuibacter sp.]
MKYIYLLLFVTLCGCKKYLTVQPEGSYTGPQVFSNEKAIQQALNGLYNLVGSDSLYGGNLSMTTVELLAQQYNNGSYSADNVYNSFEAYSYTNTSVQAVFENVWQTAYAGILAANVFISQIDGAAAAGVVTGAHAQQMKGEAIAIRGLLHFDMLRLFGPVFSTGANNPAIPYYTRPDGQTQPILTATQALDSVLADLAQAETLLTGDPVITGGVVFTPDFYAGYRNQRLNYYAVKGLQARAYLYGGQTSAAHDSALAVLTEGGRWFPWLNYTAIVSNTTSPDRIFSPEVLFGPYNQEMYINFNNYFNANLTAVDILAMQPTRLNNVFEGNQNDYRYTTTWLNGPNSYRTFFKYADVQNTAAPWRYMQPVLRKSELYYIIAETDPNPTVAFAALDSVRYNRGLPNLAATAVLTTEIKKEYQKEFIGEGQLFFYYKRTNTSTIGLGSSTYLSVAPVYQVPLPLSETTPR